MKNEETPSSISNIDHYLQRSSGCNDSNGKSVRSPSKVNDTTGSGVLRYALHLRFLCPFPKKCSRTVQRCKSDPFSAPLSKNNINIEGERRFYLYNDMRVVFPQRHSDSDEGKVCIYQSWVVLSSFFFFFCFWRLDIWYFLKWRFFYSLTWINACLYIHIYNSIKGPCLTLTLFKDTLNVIWSKLRIILV